MNTRTHTVFVTLAILILFIAVVFAGCTSSSSTPSQPNPAITPSLMPSPTVPQNPTVGTTMPATAASSSGGNTVTIQNFAFTPSSLTVPAGTTVTWTNMDSAPHTVISTSSLNVLNSPTLHNGDSFTYTFSKAGTYSYDCTIHPFMTGTVIVTS